MKNKIHSKVLGGGTIMKKILYIFTFLLILTGCSKEPENTDIKPVASNENVETPSEEAGEQPVATLPVAKVTIEDGQHDVSGEFTFLDNGTVSIQNANYDGGAPDVYLVLGSYDDEGNFIAKKTISERIDGKLENQTLEISLPEGVNIDEYDALSFWCENFQEDFGSAIITK